MPHRCDMAAIGLETSRAGELMAINIRACVPVRLDAKPVMMRMPGYAKMPLSHLRRRNIIFSSLS